MLGLKATMSVIDNSGALIAECVNVLRMPSSRGLARIGEFDTFSLFCKNVKLTPYVG